MRSFLSRRVSDDSQPSSDVEVTQANFHSCPKTGALSITLTAIPKASIKTRGHVNDRCATIWPMDNRRWAVDRLRLITLLTKGMLTGVPSSPPPIPTGSELYPMSFMTKTVHANFSDAGIYVSSSARSISL